MQAPDAQARQEIEKLQQENSQLRDEVLEFRDELLRYTGLPGQMDTIDVKIKQLKSLLVRAADALENGPSETSLQLENSASPTPRQAWDQAVLWLPDPNNKQTASWLSGR